MLTATDMVQRWEWVRHGLCKEPSDDGRIALSWTPSGRRRKADQEICGEVWQRKKEKSLGG